MRRAGFTMLEVMVATALSSILLIAAISLMGFFNRAENLQRDRFAEVSELSTAHGVLRRAMQTLVSEPSPEDLGVQPPPAGVVPDGGATPEPDNDQSPQQDPEGDGDPSLQNRREKDRALRRAGGEIDLEGEAVQAAPRFRLAPADDAVDGWPVRLEAVMLEHPVALAGRPVAPAVRGAFDLLPEADGTWTFAYIPVEPPGPAVRLVSRVYDLRWTVLSREATGRRSDVESESWRENFAADERRKFPRAVRLQLMTESGAIADWLFDPAVTVGAAP